MTFGELKETEMYINAEDVDICINGEDSIDDEYFYEDDICLLDHLPVVGTAHFPNGILQVDLICTNWDKKYDSDDWIPEPFIDYKDYFKEALIPKDMEGIRPDIAEIINNDINKYRNHMIKQYNENKEKATDEFCFRKFLNDYSTAINVFGLHEEYNCKGSFNRFISSCWQILNGEDKFCQ